MLDKCFVLCYNVDSKDKHKNRRKQMANRMKVTAEYEHKYGINQVETVFEVRMSKKNAAKFAKKIEAKNNCGTDLYAAYEMIDENTVAFATGYINENHQVEEMMIEDIIIIVGNYKFSK